MCKEPAMCAPRSGCPAAYSLRIAMRPGISVSAILISLRPQSASLRSFTIDSVFIFIAAFIDRLLAGSRASGGPRRSKLIGEGLRFVSALPREFLFLAAEVAVGGGLLVDRPREIEHF